MAIYSNVLAREIHWTEEPGGLQFMGPQESDTAEHAGAIYTIIAVQFYIRYS